MATAKKIVYNDNSPIIVDYASMDNRGNSIANYYLPASSFTWSNLSGKPTKLSQFTNDSGYITSSALSGYLTQTSADARYLLKTNFSWANLPGKPTLSTVATSGSYNDLTDKPAIPSLSGYATEAWVKSNPKYTITVSGDTLTIKENY